VLAGLTARKNQGCKYERTEANMKGADGIRWEETEHLWNKFSTKKTATGGIISNFPPCARKPCPAVPLCALPRMHRTAMFPLLCVFWGRTKD